MGCRFFKTRNLRLRYPYFLGNFYLRLVFIEPQRYDRPLSLSQRLHCLPKGNAFKPHFITSGGITQLINHIKRVTVFIIDRLVKGYRLYDCLHRTVYVFPCLPYFFRNFLRCRLPFLDLDQLFPRLQCPIGKIANRAADPNGVIIAKIPTDLADNHGDSISGEFHIQVQIKVIDSLHKPDTTNLKQIIHTFISVGKSLNDAQNQPKISIDQLLSCRFVSCLALDKKLFFLVICKCLQLRGVNATYFNLVIVHSISPVFCLQEKY